MTTVFFLAFCVAAFAVVRGRLAWARLPNRAVAVVVAVVALGVAAVAAPPSDEASTSTAPPPAATSSRSPEGSPSADRSPTAAPSAVVETAATQDEAGVAPSALPSPSQAPFALVPVPGKGAHEGDSPVAATVAVAGAASALAAVDDLVVKGRAPRTGYDRAAFGQAWYDLDRNGCDTRNDILRRDLVHLSIKAGTHGCTVLAGDAAPERYTGAPVRFEYGGASEIDIDHVVALSDAWQKGAQAWPAGRRTILANDPLNLLAVSASANRQKGDGDAATWLPSDKAFRCAYVARQVAVKRGYGLWVTAAERDAMRRVLSACPQEPLPSGGTVALAPEPTLAPTPVATTLAAQPLASAPAKTTSASAPPASTDPRFPYCKDAKAAGYGPYRQGIDPEYDWYRDADHDGTVCE